VPLHATDLQVHPMSSGTATIPIATMVPSTPVAIARGDTEWESTYAETTTRTPCAILSCEDHINSKSVYNYNIILYSGINCQMHYHSDIEVYTCMHTCLTLHTCTLLHWLNPSCYLGFLVWWHSETQVARSSPCWRQWWSQSKQWQDSSCGMCVRWQCGTDQSALWCWPPHCEWWAAGTGNIQQRHFLPQMKVGSYVNRDWVWGYVRVEFWQWAILVIQKQSNMSFHTH